MNELKISPYFCKNCDSHVDVVFQNSSEKASTYVFECKNGHLLEIFISKELVETLQKFPQA